MQKFLSIEKFRPLYRAWNCEMLSFKNDYKIFKPKITGVDPALISTRLSVDHAYYYNSDTVQQ
jgi:hypothetical protein